MNNLLIGIVTRDEDYNNDNMNVIPNNIIKSIRDKCSCIGLIANNDNYIDTDILNICHGIIIPGGNTILPYHFQIVDYCINKGIPILGICMGHQILGLYSAKLNDEDLVNINNHNNCNHNITILNNSNLHKLFGDSIIVNSRHKYCLDKIKDPFIITAKSEDNVIEAIEYIDDFNYLMGVQWHPEDMNNMDKIFIDFLKRCLIKKDN